LQLYWSDDARSVFHDYLSAHQFEFNSMTPTQSMFLEDPTSMYDDWNLPGFLARTLNARAYAQRVKLDMRLERLAEHPVREHFSAGNAADLPWDRYEAAARAYELARMGNNNLWVRDSFYNLYIGQGGAHHHRYFPDNMNPEPEMTALRELLQMLQLSKVKTLFVMQPLNPRLYDDIHSFDPIDARVALLCREYGMRYMDMYQQPYEPGVLRDGTHPGELGWEQIDIQIAEYFGL
jgi:poly-D-alanine transfer protein DltD